MTVHTTTSPLFFYITPYTEWGPFRTKLWCRRINTPVEVQKEQEKGFWFSTLNNPKHPYRLAAFTARFGDPEKAFEEVWSTHTFWGGIASRTTEAGVQIAKWIVTDIYEKTEIHPLTGKNTLKGLLTKAGMPLQRPIKVPLLNRRGE